MSQGLLAVTQKRDVCGGEGGQDRGGAGSELTLDSSDGEKRRVEIFRDDRIRMERRGAWKFFVTIAAAAMIVGKKR